MSTPTSQSQLPEQSSSPPPQTQSAPAPLSSSSTTTKSCNNVTLRRATRIDLPSMALVLAKAFLDFELYDHFLPGRKDYFPQYYRFLLRRLKGIWAEPNTRFYVAEMPAPQTSSLPASSVDAIATGSTPVPTSATTVMVGFAAWEANGETHPLATLWRSERNTWANALERRLVKLDQQYTQYFLNRIADHRMLRHLKVLLHHTFDNLDASLHLQFLATDPDYRGIGAGGLLLDQGLEVARSEGLPVVLESSLAGWKFYEYKGFKVCKWVRIEKIEGGIGYGEPYDLPIMLWEPKGMEGRWLEEDGEGGWRLKGKIDIVDGGLM